MTTPTPQRRGAYARLWLGGPYGDILTTLAAAARERSGVLVLTGDVGSGKTLLTQALIERLRVADMLVGELPFPHLDPLEFLRSVAMAYGLQSSFETREAFQLEFESFLQRAAADRKKVLFVIDEAQELTPGLFEDLEQVLLPDSAAPPVDRAPVSVLLVGQTKLDAILQEPSHAALTGRVTAHCRLRPLTDDEVAKYLAYRGPEPSPAGLRKVLREAKGVPRLIDHVARQLMVSPVKPRVPAAPVVVSGKGVQRSSRRRRRHSHGRLQLSRRVTTALVGGAVIVALVLGVTGYRVLQARQTSPDTETRGGAVEEAATPSRVSSPDTRVSSPDTRASSPDAMADTATHGGGVEHAATPPRVSSPDPMVGTAKPGRIVERAATPSRPPAPNPIDDMRTPIDDEMLIDDETMSDLHDPPAVNATRPILRTPETRRAPAGPPAAVTDPRPRVTPPSKTPQAGDGQRRAGEQQPISMSPPPAAAVPGREERPAPRTSSGGSTVRSAGTPAAKPPQTQAGATDSNPGAVIDWLLNKRDKPR